MNSHQRRVALRETIRGTQLWWGRELTAREKRLADQGRWLTYPAFDVPRRARHARRAKP